MKLHALLLALSATLVAPAGFAQMKHDHSGHGSHAMPAPAADAKPAEGTVRKVDKAAGKITIAHGPLESLGMPAMTMAFRATDPAMLDKVKAGDKIRFVADRVDGVFSVKQLEVAQ